MAKAKKKPLTPERAAELRKTMRAIEKELGMGAEPEREPESLTSLRKKLKEHREMMRQAGSPISLDDERTENLILRAIEMAKAPRSAQGSAPDGQEVLDDAARHERGLQDMSQNNDAEDDSA